MLKARERKVRLQASIRVAFRAWMSGGEGRGDGGGLVEIGSKAILKVASRLDIEWRVGRVGEWKRIVLRRRGGGGGRGNERGGLING